MDTPFHPKSGAQVPSGVGGAREVIEWLNCNFHTGVRPWRLFGAGGISENQALRCRALDAKGAPVRLILINEAVSLATGFIADGWLLVVVDPKTGAESDFEADGLDLRDCLSQMLQAAGIRIPEQLG